MGNKSFRAPLPADAALPDGRWLSTRQLAVLTGLWNGESQKEMAGRLNLSPATIQTHLVHLRKKFEAKTNLHLCRKALAAGVLSVSR